MRVEILHSGGRYPERVASYLASLSPEGVDVYQVAQSLPPTLEAVESLPAELGSADVIVALSIHPELLLAVPEMVAGGSTSALIVPIDDPLAIKPGLQRQLAAACRRGALETAFPRPFCALEPATPLISAFCEEYGIGAPSCRVELEKGRVSAVDVRRGAPCGLTDFAAEGLLEMPADLEALTGQLAQLHSRYPCLGSTQPDPVTGKSNYDLALALLQHCLAGAIQEARTSSSLP